MRIFKKGRGHCPIFFVFEKKLFLCYRVWYHFVTTVQNFGANRTSGTEDIGMTTKNVKCHMTGQMTRLVWLITLALMAEFLRNFNTV